MGLRRLWISWRWKYASPIEIRAVTCGQLNGYGNASRFFPNGSGIFQVHTLFGIMYYEFDYKIKDRNFSQFLTTIFSSCSSPPSSCTFSPTRRPSTTAWSNTTGNFPVGRNRGQALLVRPCARNRTPLNLLTALYSDQFYIRLF